MDVVSEFWPIIGGAVGTVIWLVRLEAGMLRNREGIMRLEEQRRDDVRDAKTQRDKVDTKLDHISDTLNTVRLMIEGKADRG